MSKKRTIKGRKRRKSREKQIYYGMALLAALFVVIGLTSAIRGGTDDVREASKVIQDASEGNLKKEEETCFEHRVRYFIQNSNEWRTAKDWPPPEAVPVKFYLTSNAALQTSVPVSGEACFTYNPENPAPSTIVDQKKRMLMADWSEI